MYNVCICMRFDQTTLNSFIVCVLNVGKPGWKLLGWFYVWESYLQKTKSQPPLHSKTVWFNEFTANVKETENRTKKSRTEKKKWEKLVNYYMGVSKNNGTPTSSHFNRGFHYKPSILGYPYFWKHPYVYFPQISLDIYFWQTTTTNLGIQSTKRKPTRNQG